ncbi:VTT domain-containing protein [uncultured Ilyobacter sp.]|uniref:TVP38/TMEM64 family protein n=1 Tax=uncultured Ilyobacter sp. TaxID=544433 RepID=UPI0029C65C94|nr:VTT domain-containing protein [uncultured Ilyobacter sp.]
MFSLNDMLKILTDNSSIAIPISILINIIIALLGIFPSVFITGANIIFFGAVKGFFISLLGETIGAYITFTLYRAGFKEKISKLVDRNKLIYKIISSDGKRAGLFILQGRLIPFIPSGAVTLAASISNVNSKIFTVSTMIGKAPSIALEALVSYNIINVNDNWIRLFLTVILLMLVKFLMGEKNKG